MNKLSTARRAAVVGAFVEGNSIRSTCRMTGVSIPTTLKLLVSLGRVCLSYQDLAFRNLTTRRLQIDEIWQYVYAKAKNVPADKRETFGYGDVWTWVAIDADTKLVPSWRIGPRDAATAFDLMQDLAARLSNRVQLTTDGFKPYLSAVEDAFGGEIDYAMLVKLYGSSGDVETRYSPAKCIGCIRTKSPVTRIQSTSACPTSNARTSRCGCRCADSPA